MRFFPAGVAAGAIIALSALSGCGSFHMTNCADGQCVTTNVQPGSTTQPATSVTPTPGLGPASIPGTSPTPDAGQALSTCFPGELSRDALVTWVQGNRSLLQGCLAIPPQVMDYFIQTLLSDIFTAPPQTWQDPGSYDQWRDNRVVPLVQRCQRG
jgi:hypothetical protein